MSGRLSRVLRWPRQSVVLWFSQFGCLLFGFHWVSLHHNNIGSQLHWTNFAHTHTRARTDASSGRVLRECSYSDDMEHRKYYCVYYNNIKLLYVRVCVCVSYTLQWECWCLSRALSNAMLLSRSNCVQVSLKVTWRLTFSMITNFFIYYLLIVRTVLLLLLLCIV